MRILHISIATLALLAFTACGGDDAEPAEPSGASDNTEEAAGEFAVAHLERYFKGQTGQMYDEDLHPEQKALIDRDLYVRCQAERVRGFDLKDAEVEETRRETARVPGTNTDGDSVAVTVALTAETGGQELTDTNTVSVFFADGRWWAVTPSIDDFEQGRCPF